MIWNPHACIMKQETGPLHKHMNTICMEAEAKEKKPDIGVALKGKTISIV